MFCLVEPIAKNFLFCAFLLVGNAFSGLAQAPESQDYVVKVWGPGDGLTEDSVTDVAQTPEGYLWVGTVFGSVLRFDGTRFVSYNSVNTPEFSLKWGRPNLMVDREGTLWISMHDGGMTTWNEHGFHFVYDNTDVPDHLLWSAPGRVIFIYDNGKLLFGKKSGDQWAWQIVTPPNTPARAQYAADARGQVWYLRADGRISMIDGASSNAITLMPGVQGQKPQALIADDQGQIWLGTDHALAAWNNGHFEVMIPTNGEQILNVTGIVSSGHGNLWVWANARMRCCQGRQWTTESTGWNRELAPKTGLNFLQGDLEGGLWAGANDLGLIHVSVDGGFHRLTTRDGLPSNTIGFAYEDHDGNIWTGFERGGLVQIHPRLFHNIGQSEGLGDHLINTVSEDAHGALWMGTHSGHISCYQDGAFTNYDLPESPDAEDSCVTVDSHGGIWAGARDAGLWKFDEGQAKLFATQAQLQSYPRQLLATHDGRIWVATVWSIICVANGNFTVEYTTQSVGGHPTALAETADGTVWAGTLAGILMRWDGKQFVPVEPPGKDSLGRIWALYPGEDNSLWAGTEEGGLLHWSHGKFFRYTIHNGLPSDSIEQILVDAQGNLWLGTRAGIVRISASAFADAETNRSNELPISFYGQTDGLLTTGSAIIYQPNCWRSQNGDLFFGMDNSVAEVNSAQIHLNPIPPTVVLENISCDGKSIWPARVGAVLTSNDKGSQMPALQVGPGRNDLEFDYTGLSLHSPGHMRFKYRLEGLENSWNDAGAERKAVYRHVPPGRYLFHIMACNSDSVWGDDYTLLTATVNPFFYQTFWFRGSLVLLIVAAMFGGVIGYMRRRTERLQRQHELERERSRIAQDLHDDLGAGLTEIGLLGGLLQDPAQFSMRKQEALDCIVQRCHDLVMALDEIVWAVNPRNDSVNSLGNYLCRYAQNFLELAGIRCRLEMLAADPDHPLNSEQRHNLFLTFKEALTNIARHSGATEVRIKISVEKGRCLIDVRDNGRGLPVLAKADGEGLVNLRQRMANIGGHCEINNSPGSGVLIHLNLPLNASSKPPS